MHRHVLTALTTLGVTASGLVLTALPSHAAYTTSIGALSTATPGHVTGTVTTGAPYVVVSVIGGEWAYQADSVTVTGHPGGTLDFDLETWGLDHGIVTVTACDAQDSGCDAPVETDVFETSDVAPTVTFPDDSTIGSSDEYTVAVTDPSGGGILRAAWEHSWEDMTTVAREGSTPLPLNGDGTGAIRIFRCHEVGINVCSDTGVSTAATVNKTLSNWTDDYWLGELNPTRTPLAPRISVNESVPAGQKLTLDWYVVDSLDGQPVAGVSGQVTDIGLDDQGTFRPSILVPTLTANRNHYLRGTLSYTDPEFGVVSGEIREVTFRVDTAAPPIGSITQNRSTVYPYADGYQDSVTVKVTPGVWEWQHARLDVVNDATGVIVKTYVVQSAIDVQTFTWNGSTKTGALASAGRHRLRVTLSDDAGNKSVNESRTVTVVRKKLAARTYNRTITPKASFVRQIVGACSVVKKPSARGWYGSFGLYSNTKCTRSEEASYVETHHALRVPAAIKYGDARISLYGGAARARRGSIGVIAYFNANEQWGSAVRVGSALGTHHGATRAAGSLLHDGRWLYWAAFTGFGARYDVKTFTVRVGYQVLVPE